MDAIANAGSINELGWLNSFDSLGFTPSKCISELIANSYDAGAKNIKFDLISLPDHDNADVKFQNKCFIMIDDGTGMNLNTSVKMFNAYECGNSEIKRMGNYGIGAKPALYLLSNKRFSYIITKYDESTYTSIYVPWENMVSTGKYTDKVRISSSSKKDTELYDKYNRGTGTMIIIPSSIDIVNTMERQLSFNYDKTDEYILTDERFGITFGRFTDLTIKWNNTIYPMYNPITVMNSNYDKFTIHIFKDTECNSHSNEKYIYIGEDNSNNYYIFDGNDEVCCTKPRIISSDDFNMNYKRNRQYRYCGTFIYKVYKPPSNDVRSAKQILSYYDEQYFSNNGTEPCNKGKYYHYVCEFVNSIKMIRNSQYIGGLQLSSKNSKRASKKNMFKSLIHTDLHYNPCSTQNNELDKIIGVQVNKTQLNVCLTKPFLRLLEYFRDIYFDKIYDVQPPSPITYNVSGNELLSILNQLNIDSTNIYTDKEYYTLLNAAKMIIYKQ